VGPTNHSAGLGGESEALFLGSSESVQLCWVSVNGCHVRGPPTGSVCQTYVDWHGKRTWRVGRVFPIGCTSSNHCDSRI
jgi:hypothetical protein